MPVSSIRDPFSGCRVVPSDLSLFTPQARVVAALCPGDPADPPFDWPTLTKAQLSVRAGYTAISGTTTRALNGIRPGSKSGDPHPGLLARKMIEEVVLDIDGVSEVNYRITPLGIRACQAYLEAHGGRLPPVRDRVSSTNLNQGKGETHRSRRGEGAAS